MTRDEIIKLAKDAGLVDPSPYITPWPNQLDAWERFAALVAAAEREACAKACRDYWAGLDALGEDDYQTGRGRAALDLRQAINARSIQPPRVGD